MMTTQDNGRGDPDIEGFIRDNKEMVEKLLAREREIITEALEQERANLRRFAEVQGGLAKDTLQMGREYAGEYADLGRKRAEDAAQGVVSMFTDPDFQRHIVSAGMEFMMAFDALLRAAPLPEFAKDAVNRARDLREETMDSRRGADTGRGSASGGHPQKIPISEPEQNED